MPAFRNGSRRKAKAAARFAAGADPGVSSAAAAMRANRFRLRFASMTHVLRAALRRLRLGRREIGAREAAAQGVVGGGAAVCTDVPAGGPDDAAGAAEVRASEGGPAP